MLALNTEAQKVLVKASGRFERYVIEAAHLLAQEHAAPIVDARHIEMAMRSLVGENSTLAEALFGSEGSRHVGKLAG